MNEDSMRERRNVILDGIKEEGHDIPSGNADRREQRIAWADVLY